MGKTRGIIDDASGEADCEDVTLDEVFEYMNSLVLSDSASNIIEQEMCTLQHDLRRLRAEQTQRKYAEVYDTSNEETSSAITLPAITVTGTTFTALPGEEETLRQKSTLFLERCCLSNLPCSKRKFDAKELGRATARRET